MDAAYGGTRVSVCVCCGITEQKGQCSGEQDACVIIDHLESDERKRKTKQMINNMK